MQSKKELRRTDYQLLRRVQRKINQEKEKAKAESPIFKNNAYLELEKAEEEIFSLSQQPEKNTRLHLFVNKRGFR